MASSKVVVASTSTTNTDLPRQTSICSLSTFFADLQNSDQSKSVASMSMDDLLKNIYSDGKTESQAGEQEEEEDDYSSFPVASISRQGSYSLPKDVATKTVDEVWKDIVTGNDQAQQREVLTLEDFLTKAGVAREDEVVRVPVLPGPEGYGVEVAINDQFQVRSRGGPLIGYVNGSERRLIGAGRGKRKVVEEPVDKATQQKQRRMIKNRESAARSRERKQAYTVELETLVTQLEEENARLLREEAEQIKERRKQLKENLIPVVEKRRPPRALRRVRSVHW